MGGAPAGAGKGLHPGPGIGGGGSGGGGSGDGGGDGGDGGGISGGGGAGQGLHPGPGMPQRGWLGVEVRGAGGPDHLLFPALPLLLGGGPHPQGPPGGGHRGGAPLTPPRCTAGPLSPQAGGPGRGGLLLLL